MGNRDLLWCQTQHYREDHCHPEWHCGCAVGPEEAKEFQWDSELFAKVKGTPWAPVPGRTARPEEAEELAESVSVEPELPDVKASEAAAADRKEVLRRVYIRQADLEVRGYTASCPACGFIRAGVSREGVPHTEFCRARVVEKLGNSEEGKKRLEAARRKDPPKRFKKTADLEPVDRSAVSAPGPGKEASAALKRETEEPSAQEAQPAKKPREASIKKARVQAEEPHAVPEGMEVSVSFVFIPKETARR